jgi:uncharacterized RDD family membrane protein YckC
MAADAMDVRTRVQSAAPARPQARAAEPPADTPYIGLVTRIIAFAIDAAIINGIALLVGVVITLISSVFPASKHRDAILVAIGGVVYALWIIGYFTAFWTTTGQTPGNRLMEIRVARDDGSRLRPRHAITRLFGMLISWPLLWGFLPILVSERRRGVPDWLAGTVVIGAPREPASGR